MAHMKPVVQKGEWWKVGTQYGTEFVSTDVADTKKELNKLFALRDILTCERVMGYGARLSAPGYLDATEWTVFDSEKAAWSYLLENYEDAFTWQWEPGHGYHLYCPSESVAEIIKNHFQSINGSMIEQDIEFLYTVDESEKPTDEVEWEEV